MFAPGSSTRLLRAFLLAVLLGLFLVQITKASEGECSTEYDDCYAIIYTPKFCEMVEPYGWWWYYANCGAGREATAMVAMPLPMSPGIAFIPVRVK